jgi:hypothetical protein
MKFELFDHQKKAINQLKTGSILRGGVGSGKSLTALAYYFTKECGGQIASEIVPMTKPKDLYVITVANKRDSLDWKREAVRLGISTDRELNPNRVQFIVDSWNNIEKYKEIKNAFFIFDEQKVIGSGSWAKSFIKISKENNWILLTATPGDVWSDYIPVFVANGFFKNRTDFLKRHAVFNNFTPFPKIDRYIHTDILERYKAAILVEMDYVSKANRNVIELSFPYDQSLYNRIKDRWNPYKDRPIRSASEACYLFRKVVNSDTSRLDGLIRLVKKHEKVIVFYNFDYELEILRNLAYMVECPVAEYNGHMHEDIPSTDSWVYLVHYISGSEAWECPSANTIVLYSRTYSYKMTIQAMGRIDRQNSEFLDLFYYFFTSDSPIDKGIKESFQEKKNFNEKTFQAKIGLS